MYAATHAMPSGVRHFVLLRPRQRSPFYDLALPQGTQELMFIVQLERLCTKNIFTCLIIQVLYSYILIAFSKWTPTPDTREQFVVREAR